MRRSKILVSHPGKQHVLALLKVLQKENRLSTFFTLIAANKLYLNFRAIRRKAFPGIKREHIVHFPIFWVISYFFKWNLYLNVYRRFDRKIAKKLPSANAKLIIGYENANLETFKKAKELGMTTILDMAYVHHEHLKDLWRENPSYSKALSEDRAFFENMNTYKTEAYKYTDYCFCLSTYARDTMLQGGLKPEQLFTINLGINTQLFSPKKTYAKPGMPFNLLFVGRMSAIKGILEMVEVMKEIKEEYHDIHLKLVGPLNRGESILDNLPQNVSYHPFLPHEELVKEYTKADLFVHFTFTDSWAQTVIESMACGTPAIVTEHTGAKDAILKGGGGVIIPVGDQGQLKKQILHFYHHREELEPLGKAAAKVAHEQYAWENYNQQVMEALAQIETKELATT